MSFIYDEDVSDYIWWFTMFADIVAGLMLILITPIYLSYRTRPIIANREPVNVVVNLFLFYIIGVVDTISRVLKPSNNRILSLITGISLLLSICNFAYRIIALLYRFQRQVWLVQIKYSTSITSVNKHRLEIIKFFVSIKMIPFALCYCLLYPLYRFWNPVEGNDPYWAFVFIPTILLVIPVYYLKEVDDTKLRVYLELKASLLTVITLMIGGTVLASDKRTRVSGINTLFGFLSFMVILLISYAWQIYTCWYNKGFGSNTDESITIKIDNSHKVWVDNDEKISSTVQKSQQPYFTPLGKYGFRNIFVHQKTYTSFRSHIQSEFSVENLDFVMTVRKYKCQVNNIEALNIYNRYIKETSEAQVNLPSTIKIEIDNFFTQFSEYDIRPDVNLVTIFDKAMEEIIKLMSSDSWKRFLDTDEGKQIVASRAVVN